MWVCRILVSKKERKFRCGWHGRLKKREQRDTSCFGFWAYRYPFYYSFFYSEVARNNPTESSDYSDFAGHFILSSVRDTPALGLS